MASTTVMTTEAQPLSEAGKTSRATKIDTQAVSEPGGAPTRVMDTPRGNETQLMDSNPLAGDATGQLPEANQRQTNPELEALRQQTKPALEVLPAVVSRSKGSAPVIPDSAHITTPPVSPPQQEMIALPSTPPPRPKGWIIALGDIALFGLIFLTFLLLGRANRPTVPVTKAPPPLPPAVADTSGESFLSEEGALISEDDTVITKKFPLVSTSKFSLSNVGGNITIEGTEGGEAEVKVIKTGGSTEERNDIKIIYSTAGGNLTLKTPQLLNNNVDIAYEVKVPRSLSQVNIQAVSSKIRIANVDALVDVKTTSGAMEMTKLVGAVRIETETGDVMITQSSGDIGITTSKSRVELQSVNGTVDVNNTAGDTRAIFDSSTLSDSLNFESISGNIDVRFRSELNAELDANTISGTMDVQGLGVEVKKSPGFSQAAGPVGIGGHPLKVKTVSGNIKVKKSP